MHYFFCVSVSFENVFTLFLLLALTLTLDPTMDLITNKQFNIFYEYCFFNMLLNLKSGHYTFIAQY